MPRFACGYERYARKILTGVLSIVVAAKAWKKQVLPDPHVTIILKPGQIGVKLCIIGESRRRLHILRMRSLGKL